MTHRITQVETLEKYIIICVGMITLCSCNIKGITNNAVGKWHYISGIALIILPFLFRRVSTKLQGNVETDFQYLVLRTFQGLDAMYIWLIVASVISFVLMVFLQNNSSKTK